MNKLKIKLKGDKFNVCLITRYNEIKRQYRKLVKQKNKEFQKKNILKKLEDIDKNKPKAMWDIIKSIKAKKKQNIPITIDEFKEYFKQLLNNKIIHNNNNSKLVENIKILLDKNEYIEILDKEISMTELKKGMNKLKNGVASGEDYISNETLKYSFKYLGHAFLKVFNQILKNVGH